VRSIRLHLVAKIVLAPVMSNPDKQSVPIARTGQKFGPSGGLRAERLAASQRTVPSNRHPVKRVKPKVHQSTDSTLRQAQSLRGWRADDRIWTLMRHIGLGVPLPVSLLATTMRQFARRRSLVTAGRSRQLSLPDQFPAGLATVALSTVAAATHRKHGTTVGVEASARTQTLDGMFC
jgi:hypothetical protein